MGTRVKTRATAAVLVALLSLPTRAQEATATSMPLPPGTVLLLPDGTKRTVVEGCYLPASTCLAAARASIEAKRLKEAEGRIEPSVPFVAVGAMVVGFFALGYLVGKLDR